MSKKRPAGSYMLEAQAYLFITVFLWAGWVSGMAKVIFFHRGNWALFYAMVDIKLLWTIHLSLFYANWRVYRAVKGEEDNDKA